MLSLCMNVKNEAANLGGYLSKVTDFVDEILPHIHPQSEIMKLLCNNEKVRKLLNWQVEFNLEEGIAKTTEWIKQNSKMI